MLRGAPLRVRYLASGCLMLVVQTIFGGYSLLVHSALSGSNTLHPLVFALLRDTLGTAALLIALRIEQARAAAAAAAADGASAAKLPLNDSGEEAGAPPPPAYLPTRADAFQLLLCGVCGVWCSQAGSALTLKYLDPVTMSLLQPLLPLVTALGSLACGYEVWALAARSTWLKAGGLAVSVGGACFVGYASAAAARAPGAPPAAAASLALGLAFCGVQLVGGGLYCLCQAPLLAAGRTPLWVAAWGYAAGWCLLALCTASGATGAGDWAWTRAALGAAVYSGLLSSAFNYGVMATVVDLAGPLFQAAFFPLMPVATVVLAWAASGELPSAAQGGGGAACALGLALFVAGKFREAAERRTGGEGEGARAALLAGDAEQQ